MKIPDAARCLIDFSFYKEAKDRSFKSCSAHIALLGLFFSTALAAALSASLIPSIQKSLLWAADSLPPLTLENGVLSGGPEAPLKLRHPETEHVSFILDTHRSEPVTAEELQKNGVLAYATRNAVYLAKLRPVLESRSPEFLPGFSLDGVETHALSRFSTSGRLVFDRILFEKTARRVPFLVLPAVFIVSWIIFFVWKHGSALLYSGLAAAIAGLQGSRLEFPQLYALAVYAQTTVVALQIAALFLSEPIRYFGFISLAVVASYLWKAVSIVADPIPEALSS